MRKRMIALLCAAVILLTGCAARSPSKPEQDDMREFTDSTGRVVTVPKTVEKIAVSGPLAQVYVLPLCPDLMVGFAAAFSNDASQYFPAEILALPELGQLYGGKAEMDLEALLAADPDVVIDVGDPKSTIVEDMDRLTEQTGIPFVHIDASVVTAPETYRKLGELTGKTEKAEQLATWCEAAYAMITELMSRVDADDARKSILYCLGSQGTNVMAKGSFHAGTIDLMGRNIAELAEVSSSGDGNEVDLEQIVLWDPDVIIFSPESIYSTVAEDPAWQSVTAVTTGQYYETPAQPYGWLSTPPAVQRYLGMLWLGAVLYPDYANYDLQEKVTEYYELFYNCTLTDEMYRALTVNALG